MHMLDFIRYAQLSLFPTDTQGVPLICFTEEFSAPYIQEMPPTIKRLLQFGNQSFAMLSILKSETRSITSRIGVSASSPPPPSIDSCLETPTPTATPLPHQPATPPPKRIIPTGPNPLPPPKPIGSHYLAGTPDALAELGKATIKGEVSILGFFADIWTRHRCRWQDSGSGTATGPSPLSPQIDQHQQNLEPIKKTRTVVFVIFVV